MLLYPRHYVRFLDGREGNFAVAAFLPGDLAACIPTLSTEVRIGRDHARKLWEKHRLGHADLGVIQRAIDNGWCTKSRNAALDFLYIDQTMPARRFVLGIKATYGGQETWVSTLHRSDEHQIRRRLRRARETDMLLRTHVWT
jgi:hypothetical protein